MHRKHTGSCRQLKLIPVVYQQNNGSFINICVFWNIYYSAHVVKYLVTNTYTKIHKEFKTRRKTKCLSPTTHKPAASPSGEFCSLLHSSKHIYLRADFTEVPEHLCFFLRTLCMKLSFYLPMLYNFLHKRLLQTYMFLTLRVYYSVFSYMHQTPVPQWEKTTNTSHNPQNPSEIGNGDWFCHFYIVWYVLYLHIKIGFDVKISISSKKILQQLEILAVFQNI